MYNVSILAAIGIFLLFKNAEKIKKSKYWSIWILVYISLICQLVPLLALVLDKIDPANRLLYFGIAYTLAITTALYINVVRPYIRLRKEENIITNAKLKMGTYTEKKYTEKNNVSTIR